MSIKNSLTEEQILLFGLSSYENLLDTSLTPEIERQFPDAYAHDKETIEKIKIIRAKINAGARLRPARKGKKD